MEFLANGSVVQMLNSNNEKIEKMIIGRLLKGSENKVYDYIGVIYPFGFISDKSLIGFSNEAINHILFKGYESETEVDMRSMLQDKYEDVKTELNV